MFEIARLARDAELLAHATCRGGRDVFPGERMAGATVGKHPTPKALELAATTEQQARVFAPALN